MRGPEDLPIAAVAAVAGEVRILPGDCLVFPGDCLEVLRTLGAESVHAVVTSPPYWGLRDYQIPPTRWGDGALCCLGLEATPELYVDHLVEVFREVRRVLRRDGTLWVNLGDSFANGTKWGGSTSGKHAKGLHGATGIGRTKHPTPNTQHPTSNAEVTAWAGKHPGRLRQNGLDTRPRAVMGPEVQPNRLPIAGLKPGDMVGIPWRVAFALQADGWYLRRDNVWHKPAPMPESVNGVRWERCRVRVGGSERASASIKKGSPASGQKPHGAARARDALGNAAFTSGAQYRDCEGCAKCAPHGGYVLRRGAWRCTTAHEYVFQFARSAEYFCDAEASKEGVSGQAHARGRRLHPKTHLIGREDGRGHPQWSAAMTGMVGSRNRRSVWTINTRPFPGAHFATFPPALVAPIIRSATPPLVCGQCGAPFAPVVERGAPDRERQRRCGSDRHGEYHGRATKDYTAAGAENAAAVKARILAGMLTRTVSGYRATCRCAATATGSGRPTMPPAPPFVLDPFAGSGTVGQVCQELGRSAILIELAAHYLPLIEARLRKGTRKDRTP